MPVKSEGGGMLSDALVAEIEQLEARLTVLRELHAEASGLEERIHAELNGTASVFPPSPEAPKKEARKARRPGGASRSRPSKQTASGRSTTAAPRQAAEGEPHPKSAAAAALKADEVHDLLSRGGPMTEAEIRKATGFGSRSVPTALYRLQSDGRAHPTEVERSGPQGGRASREWAVGSEGGGASSEPEAGADSAEVTPRPAPAVRPAPAPPSPEDTQPEHTQPEHTRRNMGAAEVLKRQVAAEVDDYLQQHGPSTVDTMHDALQLADRGMAKGGFLQLLQRSGSVETLGNDGRYGKALWRRIPKPEEQEGLEIRYADRNGTVEGRLLACLDTRGKLTVEQLASHLVLPTPTVGQTCTKLAREGLIAKGPGGKYELTASVAA